MSAGGDDRLWRPSKGGIVLRVRATPKADRDAVGGVRETANGPALEVRVRAAPEDGAANSAIEAAIAAWLGVAKRDVSVISGQTSRVKSVAVAGEVDVLGARVDMLVVTAEPRLS